MTDWMKQAGCKDKDPALWFAVRPGNHGRDRRKEIDPYADARAICTGECPVRLECLEYSLVMADKLGQLDGMFGGLDDGERIILRRQRRRAS